MKAKIFRTVLLLMIATQVMTTFTAAELTVERESAEYENAGVTPIYWTKKDGTALVLLGKEKRGRAGEVWCDFFGKKDEEDNNNPIVTAKREAEEESAGQLVLYGEPLHVFQGKKNKSTVHCIWEAEYIDPQEIQESAKKLEAVAKRKGRRSHVEKTNWKWVTLKNLLEGETGLKLHWTLEKKLENPIMRPWFVDLATRKEKGKSHHKPRKYHSPRRKPRSSQKPKHPHGSKHKSKT